MTTPSATTSVATIASGVSTASDIRGTPRARREERPASAGVVKTSVMARLNRFGCLAARIVALLRS